MNPCGRSRLSFLDISVEMVMSGVVFKRSVLFWNRNILCRLKTETGIVFKFIRFNPVLMHKRNVNDTQLSKQSSYLCGRIKQSA